MNRATLVRLFGLVAGVSLVASCDTATTTGTQASPSSGGTTGSTSTSGSTANANGLTISVDSPVVGTLVNVGDSVFVRLHLHGNKALKSATVQAFTVQGSVDLGTYTLTPRYTQIAIPVSGAFRSGLLDTTVRRYLQPASKDTSLDSLVILVTASDNSNGVDTATRTVLLVSGPKVNIVAPSNGDSVPAGVGITVSSRAQSANGVGRIDIRVQGQSNWPTKLDTTISQVYSNGPQDVTFTTTARIPLNAPVHGQITVTSIATDANRQPGSSAPVLAFVRPASSAQPRVTQIVPAKTEFADSISVSATGDAITTLGVVVRD